MLYYSHDGGVQDPENLINNLEQNVRLLRDITFKKLKNSETVDSIEKRIAEMIPGTLSRNRGPNESPRGNNTRICQLLQTKGLAVDYKRAQLPCSGWERVWSLRHSQRETENKERPLILLIFRVGFFLTTITYY